MRPQVGQVINNKYRLIRIIGDGGMGSVYEARHELLSKTVALKFLHPELSKRSGLVQRFLQEARISAQIQSPHVVQVIDVDQQQGGLAYIVMEYLEGKTLQTLYEDLYKAGQRLSYGDAIEYSMQMLEGVEAAHSAGIVHRDLKPDNVIITRDKRGDPLLKLLDFGIAKLKVTGQMERGLTRAGVVMGTPEYMAPEQAYSADAVDSRADIFSLGVMIFEMLAGRRPVGGDDPHQIATAYLTGQIAKLTDLAPSIAPDLANVIHKAMGAQPKDRYNSVAEFRAALEPHFRAAKSGALTAAPTPMPGQVTPADAMSPVPLPSGIQLGSTPATNVPDEPRLSGVPKTIPPEESDNQAPAPMAAAPAQGTPLGGFAVSSMGDGGAAVVAPFERGASAPPPQSGLGFAETGLSPGAMPATVSAAPYMMAGNGYGGAMPPTVDAAPYMANAGGAGGAGGVPATAFEAQGYDGAGRTAVGASPYNGAAAQGYPMPAQGTQAGMPGLPGTAAMNPYSMIPAPQADTSRKSGGGTSMLTILLIAASVSAVVVGGLYLGQRFLRPVSGDGDGTVTTSQPTTQVPVTPIGSTSATEPPPVPSPPVSQSQPPPLISTAKPPTSSTWTSSTSKPPTTNPSASASSTATTIPPPVIPSSFPTIVIPTSFPGFGIPHPTMPGSQPTASAPPSSTTPAPQPTGSTTSPRPRITVPKPH